MRTSRLTPPIPATRRGSVLPSNTPSDSRTTTHRSTTRSSDGCVTSSPTRNSSISHSVSRGSLASDARCPYSASISPARSTSEHSEKDSMDIATVDELLSTTRSVRKRLDLTRPASRDVILECIRLAMQAPTASNAQDWRWLVITDADKGAAIAAVYRGIAPDYRAYAARDASDPQTQRVYASAFSLTDTLGQVPVHVIPCLDNRIDNSNLLIAASAWASIIPAGWSFLLALRSRGLGSVWTTMNLAKEQEVAELLGIPPTVTQAALFPVAYTIGTDFRPASRPPAETITFWDGWGES